MRGRGVSRGEKRPPLKRGPLLTYPTALATLSTQRTFENKKIRVFSKEDL